MFDTEMFIVAIVKHECVWNITEYSDRILKRFDVGDTMFDRWGYYSVNERKLKGT